ncbi:diguanylate cyclase domain-containing protein [Stutzerimonas sp. NM35]
MLYEALFEHMREGVIIADSTGAILRVNPAFSRLTGYSQHDVQGRRLQIPHSALQPAQCHNQIWRELEEKDQWSGECRGRHKDGYEYESHLLARIVRTACNQIAHYLLFLSDFSQLKDRQKRLERIAHYDPLTELPNRILLTERMDRALLHGKRQGRFVAVAFIDLDGFKAVNDTHGHERGDRLLQIISSRLKAVLRETDTLARFGGDEFVAVLADLQQPGDCRTVLERMIEAAHEPVPVGEITFRLSASIGVVLVPPHSELSEQLIKKADQAMYQAKRAGGNRYCISSESLRVPAPLSGDPAV